MKAFIHLGLEKTGTTSFQHCLFENYKYLIGKKILYPKNLGSKNHRNLATCCLMPSKRDDHARSLQLKSQGDFDDFFSKNKSSLKSQIQDNSGASVCILSSEHFHSRLLNHQNILRFRDLIADLFEDVIFYLHLRPQVDLAVSLASTAARCHSTVNSSFFTNVKPGSLYYDYFKLYTRWKEVFPGSKIKVYPYKLRPSFMEIFKEEMLSLGPDVSDISLAKRENAALDVRAMALINALNSSSLPSEKKYRIKPSVLNLLSFEDPLRLSRDFADRFQKQFAISNHDLCQQLEDFPIENLHPDMSKYPEIGNLDLLDKGCGCPFSDQLNFILNSKLN